MVKNFEVIILAAGLGSRLGLGYPKCLTVLDDGETILGKQIHNIKKIFGIDTRITIIVGFKAEAIIEAYPDNGFIYNDKYDMTNTAKSLLKGLMHIRKGRNVLWLNGDVVFNDEVLIESLKYVNNEISFITVDNSEVHDEEVKYVLNNDGDISLLSKTVNIFEAEGEAVGINFVSHDNVAFLKECLSEVSDADYFEKGVELCIKKYGTGFKPLNISHNKFYAVEVDFADDLTSANKAVMSL